MRLELTQHKHPVIILMCPIFILNLREYLLLFNLQITVHKRHNSVKKVPLHVHTVYHVVFTKRPKKEMMYYYSLKKDLY